MVKISDHYFSVEPNSRLEKGLIQTILRGKKFEFITATGLFSSKKIDLGTRILVESMELPESGKLLDIGCGYGVIGLVAASLFPDLYVVMTDVNKRAVNITSENIKHLKLSNAIVKQGNLYEPVKTMLFDTIISNPPISAGLKRVVRNLIQGAFTQLKTEGTIQLVVQWNKGGRRVKEFLEESFSEVKVLEKKAGYRVFMAKKIS